jgi:hypothetical protein
VPVRMDGGGTLRRAQNQQQDHGQVSEFWSGEFWYDFWKATLEDWQSEFLQLATFTIAAAYLVYKGSSESPDGNERLEQKTLPIWRTEGSTRGRWKLSCRRSTGRTDRPRSADAGPPMWERYSMAMGAPPRGSHSAGLKTTRRQPSCFSLNIL